MKYIQHLLLLAETLGFSLRLWWWQKFGKAEEVKKLQRNELFYIAGKPTRYMHTIIFTKPDYVNRKMTEDAWHYYRQFKNGHWVTIRSQNKLK
jgi:hypothetical protein